jgi:hypothetical protein
LKALEEVIYFVNIKEFAKIGLVRHCTDPRSWFLDSWLLFKMLKKENKTKQKKQPSELGVVHKALSSNPALISK